MQLLASTVNLDSGVQLLLAMLKSANDQNVTSAPSSCDYWVDGSNKEDVLEDYYDVEAELGR